MINARRKCIHNHKVTKAFKTILVNNFLSRVIQATLTLVILLSLFCSSYTEASDPPAVATKTKTAGGYSTTPASFTISATQEILWEANYLGSPPEGNDFYLYRNPTNLIEFPLSTSLSPGLNTGTYILSPDTYNISINYLGMGPGSYTIYCNRTASISVLSISGDSEHDFGEWPEGETSSPSTFTIKSAGDDYDLPVTISDVALSSGDISHFEITDIPTGQQVPPDKIFRVKFKAGSISGTTPQTFTANITVSGTSTIAVPPVTITVSGTTEPKIPDIECGASDLGSADWKTGEVKTFNYSFRNIGTDSLILTDILLFNDPESSTAFSLSGTPSLDPVLPGDSRTVKIQFAPPFSGGEATYNGHLEIHSNDPDEPIKSCPPFTATAHHPVPKLHLYTSEIDYREVERDYRFHQAVKIANSGDADLTFNIELEDSTDLDVSEFELDLGPKTIPAAIPETEEIELYEMTFHPTSNGAKEISIVINNTNEEPTSTSNTIRLYGSGTDPIPLSTMLVMDRSASMNGNCGTVRKIEAARDAGKLYTELIEDSSDWLGITRYNHTYDTPVHLALISSNRIAAVDLLNGINDMSKLKPDGDTCIGGGMQTASADYSLSPAGNSLAMIVLTDGKENTSPMIADVKLGIHSAYPNLQIFCVGVGDPIETGEWGIEGVETDTLQAIADEFKGMFRVIQSLSGENRYDLESFYFKVFAKATGRSVVLDPMYIVPSISPGIWKVATVDIATCDRDVYFLVMSDVIGSETEILLKDPTGQTIVPGATVGGIAVHVKSWDKYKLFKIKFPPRSMASSYAGTWELLLNELVASKN